MNELALFAGAGGGIIGGRLLGWRTVCAVEWNAYAASILVARQNDGSLEPFPIWDDVRTFVGGSWSGFVDVVSGGFPCQDISVAGKGAGIAGERSGMWEHMARVIGEVRPRFAFVENSPALLTRGLERVLGDLAALGYDCRWTVLGADEVGAPHKRDRFWLVAHTDSSAACERRLGLHGQKAPGEPCQCSEDLAHADSTRLAQRQSEPSHARQELASIERAGWWLTEPDVGRVANGVAARVDRLKALGNGQVPLCAASAWRLLTANEF